MKSVCAAPVLSLPSHDYSIALDDSLNCFVSDHLAIQPHVIIRHAGRRETAHHMLSACERSYAFYVGERFADPLEVVSNESGHAVFHHFGQRTAAKRNHWGPAC